MDNTDKYKKEGTKRKRYGLSLDPDLVVAIDQCAKDGHRSRSQQIELLLLKCVQRMESEGNTLLHQEVPLDIPPLTVQSEKRRCLTPLDCTLWDTITQYAEINYRSPHMQVELLLWECMVKAGKIKGRVKRVASIARASIDLEGFFFNEGHSWQHKISVQPVDHHYEDPGQPPMIKWGCPICESFGGHYSFPKGEENCPICGVNLYWEEEDIEPGKEKI